MIMTVKELFLTCKVVRELPEMFSFQNSREVHNYLRPLFPDDEIAYRERFIVLFLDSSNRPIGHKLISIGGQNATIVDTRIVMSAALLCCAAGMVLSHNHPSGNRKPSEHDIKITEQISGAAKLHNFKVIDHIILMPNGDYFSFGDEGLL